MLGSYDVIAFVATQDSARARAFYEGTLGLHFVLDTPFALVFEANGTMLRVAKVQEITIAPYTVLGWIVPDIVSTATQLGAAGVVFERYGGLEQDDLGVWTSPDGAHVAWFKDPDGNTLSLTEFPATE